MHFLFENVDAVYLENCLICTDQKASHSKWNEHKIINTQTKNSCEICVVFSRWYFLYSERKRACSQDRLLIVRARDRSVYYSLLFFFLFFICCIYFKIRINNQTWTNWYSNNIRYVQRFFYLKSYSFIFIKWFSASFECTCAGENVWKKRRLSEPLNVGQSKLFVSEFDTLHSAMYW